MDKERIDRATQIYEEAVGGALYRLDAEMLRNGWEWEELWLARSTFIKAILSRQWRSP